MKKTVNAYDFFKNFGYKKYFLRHLKYMFYPSIHIKEVLLNSSSEDYTQPNEDSQPIEYINNQSILNVVPSFLIENLQNRPINSIQNNDAMPIMSMEMTSSFNIDVLHRDIISKGIRA